MLGLSTRRLVVVSAAVVCLLGGLTVAQDQQKPQSPLTVDDFDQFSWRWIGPMAFSGRATAFAVPKGQSQTYYALMASAGIWKTEDGGIHFEPIFDQYGTLSMGWLAIAPSDAKILYLGTGEPMHARSSMHGNGVWKSTDAGKTWTNIGLTKSQYIPKVEVDGKNPDIVYVAAEGKLYDNEMDCERGLFKTTDGGKTWTNLFAHIKDRGVGDFVIDPRNSDIVIAAAYKTFRRAWTYIDRHEGNDLYKTTDGGKTWKKLTAGLPQGIAIGRTGLDIYAKNPAIVYARRDEEVNLGYTERDGGANFRAAGAGLAGGGRGGAGAGGTVLFRDDATFAQFKSAKLSPEFAKAAPKFAPITADTEADLVKKLNEAIQDKDFLAKNGLDLARLQVVARKVHAKDETLMAAIGDVERLMKKEPAAADSTEAKARQQIVNRHALELLYAPALSVLPTVKRNGVVYRSDDQGETWKAMTEVQAVWRQLPGEPDRGRLLRPDHHRSEQRPGSLLRRHQHDGLPRRREDVPGDRLGRPDQDAR